MKSQTWSICFQTLLNRKNPSKTLISRVNWGVTKHIYSIVNGFLGPLSKHVLKTLHLNEKSALNFLSTTAQVQRPLSDEDKVFVLWHFEKSRRLIAWSNVCISLSYALFVWRWQRSQTSSWNFYLAVRARTVWELKISIGGLCEETT